MQFVFGNVGVLAEAQSWLVVDQLCRRLWYQMMTSPSLWTLRSTGLPFEPDSALVMCSQARFWFETEHLLYFRQNHGEACRMKTWATELPPIAIENSLSSIRRS
jgi:hypothetical protein